MMSFKKIQDDCKPLLEAEREEREWVESVIASSLSFPIKTHDRHHHLLLLLLKVGFKTELCASMAAENPSGSTSAATPRACVKLEDKKVPEMGSEWGKVSVVLFDMDGVLCNSEEPSRRAAVDVFAEMGIESRSKISCLSWAQGDLQVMRLRSHTHILLGEAKFLGGVTSAKGAEGFNTEAAKKSFFEIYLDKYAKPNAGIRFPGALELIIQHCKSKGLKVAVASSADRIRRKFSGCWFTIANFWILCEAKNLSLPGRVGLFQGTLVTFAELFWCFYLFRDNQGRLFIADTNNSIIRYLDPNKAKPELLTLELKGVQPPTPKSRSLKQLRRRTSADTETVKINGSSSNEGNLYLKISIPEGCHFSKEARRKFSVEIEPENQVVIDPVEGYLSSEGSASVHFKR
ncbi:haloacid dehalogenase-like hydrolase family protein [Actinidia rufa]|uniref:Haloacid dehalogenase-like hydrolase family protein n=1 Tax=Actinidia rufa TaxID=165716 RepID=A0A7J0G8V5_9ERIC|nr:haloacid dehalogenase-like hydrolase family protein [Actinidia rufa]